MLSVKNSSVRLAAVGVVAKSVGKSTAKDAPRAELCPTSEASAVKTTSPHLPGALALCRRTPQHQQQADRQRQRE